jgi:hypothetical protein
MKKSSGAVITLLAVALLCGCAAPNTASPFHAGDEKPPDFLVGPITMVLTNRPGFSAHVVATVGPPDGRGQTNLGELLERDGRLIFEPELEIKSKHTLAASGLLFIWNENRHSGYVVSDALQGFAPVDPALDIPTLAVESMTDKKDVKKIDGRVCHRWEAVVPFANGMKVPVTLWQTDDAIKFPMRIECSNGTDVMTLNFSELRLESPPEDLFEPPEGFTSYASASALMNELLQRNAKYTAPRTGPKPSNWQPMPGQHQ